MSRTPTVPRWPGIRCFGLTSALVFSLACGGGGSGSSGSSGGVTLTGRVPAISPTAALARPGAEAVDASTVRTVLLFAADGSALSSPVSNGAFSVAVNPGTALGMVFAGSASQFLGYLSLGNGISSLPLTKVASGVTSIDLGTLTASGTALTPANNPVTGGQLPLTAAEQTAFAQCNGMFAGVVQNPDVDGNGVIDLLESRFYHSFVSYWVNGGHFAGMLTPIVDSGVAIQYYNITLTANGSSDGTAATVTGPAGSGLSGRSCTVTTSTDQINYCIYPDLGTSSTAVPASGTYVFSTSLGKALTITVPDQSAAGSHIVIAVPTVTVSAAHTIYSISWSYQTLDGQAIADPSAIIRDLIVEIDHGLGNRVYNSSNLDASVTSQAIPSGTTIPWDNSICIYMAYNDVFQNHYVVPFYNSY